MGCLGSIGISVKAEPDPEIVKLIASIDTRLEEYKKTFETEVDKIKKKQQKALNKRHEELTKLKAEKGEIPEDAIKELNKSELKWEIDILTNQVDQLHYIFETGLALVEPLKKITLNKLMEQVKTAPAIAANKINQQIAEIKALLKIVFLFSDLFYQRQIHYHIKALYQLCDRIVDFEKIRRQNLKVNGFVIYVKIISTDI